MAYTTADRDAVKAAMLNLATVGRPETVRFTDGSAVTYTQVNVGQLQAVLNLIERDIAAAPVPGVVSRLTRAVRLMPQSGY